MKIYLAQTRSRGLIATLNSYGWGEMTSRGEFPPRRTPWAYDNGAFVDWKRGEPFSARAFEDDLTKIAASAELNVTPKPDFIVAPDIVAGGSKSLDFSLAWMPELAGTAPIYLAVQDGMEPLAVDRALADFDGLFVGGTLDWKIATGKEWVELAHAQLKRCHIGRVGTMERVRWATRISADSIDSAVPLWSTQNLERFVAALRETQLELFPPISEAGPR